MTAPVLRAHVNDDAMAWLSLDCSIARIFGNPEARHVLAPTIEQMRKIAQKKNELIPDEVQLWPDDEEELNAILGF